MGNCWMIWVGHLFVWEVQCLFVWVAQCLLVGGDHQDRVGIRF